MSISGQLYVISAPSGAGKSSLIKALIEQEVNICVSVSYTTREQKPGEVDGVDYHFITYQVFETMIANGQLLEYAIVYAKVANDYYGTGRAWVEQQLAQGYKVILELDWQGAQQVFKAFNDAIGIFILPPSLSILHQRLQTRDREDIQTIAQRMSVAKDEIAHYNLYHHIVVNDDFDQALQKLKQIIQSGLPKQVLPASTQQLVKRLLA